MPMLDYEAYVGKRLNSPIYDDNGTLLIAEGTLLNEAHIDKLSNFRIRFEEIRTVEEVLPPPAALTFADKAKLAEQYLEEIDLAIRKTGIVPLDRIEERIVPFIQETSKQYNLFKVFAEFKDKTDFRYRQSLSVAVTATAFGRRIGLDDQELSLLTVASTLYDVGVSRLPSYLVNKTSRFEHHELEIMKQHPRLGYELLLESGADPRVALVALQHHEREDGSGYPDGLKGAEMDKLSKIVAIADAYIAMISDRPHREALSFFQVVEMMHEEIRLNRFDSVMGMTFLDSLVKTQVGCEVLLSDGRQGQIVLTDANYPTRPLVNLGQGRFIDLRTEQNVGIREVLG